MEIASAKWQILYLMLGILGFTFCGFSLTTAAAISVNRLLALLLRLIYRHSNFRTSSLSCFLLPVCQYCNWFCIFLVFSRDCQQHWICCDLKFPVPLGLLSRQNLRQTKTAGKYQHVGHEQANNQGIPLNIERFKKTVSAISWVQLALLFCYSPMFIFMILSTMTMADC